MRSSKTVTWRALIVSNVVLVALVTAVVLWSPIAIGAEGPDPRSQSSGEATSPHSEAASAPEYTFTEPTDWAFLATGANFPDALGVAGVSGMALGPTLLVQKDSIPPETLAELNRLQPAHVMIIGGTGVISDTVLGQVASLAYTTDVQRLSGPNRYATAAAVSNAFFSGTGYYPRVHFHKWDDVADGNGSAQTILTMPVFETGDGVLLISAGVDVTRDIGSFGTDEVWCAVYVDGFLVMGSTRVVSVTDDEAICSTQAAEVVGFGTHTVDFVVTAAANTELWGATMWGLYNPFQGEGFRIGPD